MNKDPYYNQRHYNCTSEVSYKKVKGTHKTKRSTWKLNNTIKMQ